MIELESRRVTESLFIENLSQEFNSEVVDLVKQNGFYHYKYMSSSEKFLKKVAWKTQVVLFT